MIGRILAFAVALALVAPAAAAGSADEPDAYAVRMAVTPVAGASLQRLSLPARVLVASQSPELADVRVFDAQGQAVPIALSTASAPRQRRAVALAVMPILGAADALAVTGVSLQIDDRRRASVVRVDGTPRSAAGSKLLGILLDTRRIADPVSGLSLDLETPAGQPITFTVESSDDLKAWQPLGDKVVYRTRLQAGSEAIGFPAQDVHERYLRVTWQATSRLLSAVRVRSAAAITTRNAGPAAAPRAVLTMPTSPDRHAIEFTVPFSASIAALEIEAAGSGVVLPVRILGRNRREEPWTPIASGSVFRLTREGRTRANPAFDLQGARFRTLQIEADARTAGFVTPPRIAARLEPVEILFLASGSAPYTLAAGRTDAAAVFLPAADLAQASGATPIATLPLAVIPAQADPVVTAMAAEQGLSWRRVALWGVLLAGTALLATMVWMLMRRHEPAA